jgi:UPF0716 family protein affecting phage T7 exclusion
MRTFSSFLFVVLFTMFAWAVAEVSAFSYVADQIGFGGAVLLTIATSYAGILLLRRVGVAARQSLFDVLRRSDNGFFYVESGLRGGALSALAAVLLIIPGFLSDAVGVVFALASSGFWLRNSLPADTVPKNPDVIDLSPQDWHRVDSAERH